MRSRSFAAAWAPPSLRRTRVGEGIPSSSTMASTASAIRRQRGSLNSSRSHRGATSGHASGIMMAAARALRSASGSVNGLLGLGALSSTTLCHLPPMLLVEPSQLRLRVLTGRVGHEDPAPLLIRHDCLSHPRSRGGARRMLPTLPLEPNGVLAPVAELQPRIPPGLERLVQLRGGPFLGLFEQVDGRVIRRSGAAEVQVVVPAEGVALDALEHTENGALAFRCLRLGGGGLPRSPSCSRSRS